MSVERQRQVVPDCAALVERLKMVRFENAGAREQGSTQ